MRIAARISPFTPSFVHRFLISGLDLGIYARFCLFSPSCVHRFLISGLDLGIDASFSRFKPSCVHRFLISGLDLRIDARFSPIKHSSVHRFLISSLDLRIDAAPSLLRLRTARLQNYRRCGKEDWFRLQHHRCCTEERPAFRMTVADAGGDKMPRMRHNPK